MKSYNTISQIMVSTSSTNASYFLLSFTLHLRFSSPQLYEIILNVEIILMFVFYKNLKSDMWQVFFFSIFIYESWSRKAFSIIMKSYRRGSCALLQNIYKVAYEIISDWKFSILSSAPLTTQPRILWCFNGLRTWREA